MSAIAMQHSFKPAIEKLELGTHTLALYRWPPPLKTPKATVMLVHGLGEHMGRYNTLAYVLQQAGYEVLAYDHMGHGLSSGVSGDIDQPARLVEDLKTVIAYMHGSKTALVLLGHSMGGLVVARTVAKYRDLADAVVLSSPAFAAYTNVLDKVLLFVLPRWFAHVRVDNKLALNSLCRDAQVVREYKQDKLVHRKISSGLAAWIIEQGKMALKEAVDWNKPTLLVYAGQDRLVNPKGSAEFANAVPKEFLQTHCFNVMYHEIFNDPEKTLVFSKLSEWLDLRYGAG